MKKVILLIFVIFAFINSSALTYSGCDYSTVSRMKSIVTNINLSYNYTIIDNEAYFSVTINNLTDDIYFYDTVTDKKYYYSDSNDGELTINNYTKNSGVYKFYSNTSPCEGVSLGNKYYNFPKYNKYYTHELCSDLPNYSLCQKWEYVNYSQEEFEQLVSDYKSSKEEINKEEITVEYEKTLIDKVVEIYINNYYYILGALILVCTGIIIVNNRKNKFEL